ncbi:thioredoxin domain-containing protein [Dermacoccaceae bacterium W4C1]
MATRLTHALSPYLRQHADNPVDWWEWGEDALAEARRRDVPIFLSVGYAACHWCHVMAHESFEDEEVARALNEQFVPIKVDREERPDIDAVYMQATQALTGHGGWPMTCLLDPQGRPFHAGTYYPRQQLLALLDNAARAWTERRDDVSHSSTRITDALRRFTQDVPTGLIDDALLRTSLESLSREFDQQNGGFGQAPKFPPSMVLEFLLRHHARTGSPRALEMAAGTAEAMARGGIYDQLDGGFARYSVDAAWVVPHFEKMLYDNAQLLRVYLHLWRATGDPLPRRVAESTADFLLRRLRTEQGAFASALDADTDAVEGLSYTWTPAQLSEVLEPCDADWAAQLLTVTPDGTFEHGASTLQLRHDPDDHARWERVRTALLAARDTRPLPDRDDKVVAGWNGMAIAALTEGAMLLGREDLLDAARTCADHLVDTHLIDGRLRRVSLAGTVGSAPGFADDHGNLAEGLLVLHQATGEDRYLDIALQLLTEAEQFAADDGGFHDTGDGDDPLLTRPRTTTDNAEPSGGSALAHAFLAAWGLTGEDRFREQAIGALGPGAAIARRDPRFAGWALAAGEAVLSGPRQVAVVGPDGSAREQLWRTAWQSDSPGLVRRAGAAGEDSPLLLGRGHHDRVEAYVCTGRVCSLPVDAAAALRALLTGSELPPEG